MRRRAFIALLAGAAAWPLAARAQHPGRVYRIAVVSPSASVGDMREGGDNPNYSALFKELRRLGYVEGSNLIVERYSAEGRRERYSDLAGEVVRAKPDLVIVATNPLVSMFKEATDSIPIIGTMADPVAFGTVASVARPGGNITGISVVTGLEIWGKRLQILREAVPTAVRAGFLNSRMGWDDPEGRAVQAAARQAGISLLGPPLDSPIHAGEYRRVLEAMAREHADGLIISSSQDNFNFRRVIVQLAEQLRLPAIYPFRAYFELGGLMVYGSDIAALYRRLANYADEILRGRKPGDLPIDMESKYELLLNLKLAKALGLTMPTSLLVRADEVIE